MHEGYSQTCTDASCINACQSCIDAAYCIAMKTTDEAIAFEKRVNAAGLKIADVLRAADIDRSLWTRWKNGTTVPRLDNWRAVESALTDLTKRAA